MASIFKRGDIWWVKYYVSGKARSRSLKTTNKQKALREKQAIEAKLLQPHSLIPVEKNPNCKEFWEKYLLYAKDHKRPNTVTIETNHWAQLISVSGAERLGDIGPEQLEALKAWKKEKGHKESSINAALRDIRTIFNYAIKSKLFSGKNPVNDVPFYKLTRTLPKFHTEEQLEKLILAARKGGHQLEWVVLLGAHAGLRKIEILSARWEWFDFKNKLIHVTRYPGFEIKDHEERTIPMHTLLAEALAPHARKEGPIFTSDRLSNGKNFYPYEPKKGLIAALKEAGCATEDPFQRLRETFASLRAQKGVSIYKLSKWLGHSSVTTTQRHYAALATGYDPDIE